MKDLMAFSGCTVFPRRRIHQWAAVIMMLLLTLALAGCGEAKASAQDGEKEASRQAYPVGSYERRAADRAASGEDPDAEIIDFGSKSIFKGIRIESDENGEVVCTEADGELWYKVADKRFGTYAAFKKFVTKKSGAKALEEFAPYFWEKEGELYFVVGAKGRSVKDRSLYYLDDATKLTVSVTHTDACMKKYGIVRSQIHFVRDKKDGSIWKLDNYQIFT